jgi:hypothetical protein
MLLPALVITLAAALLLGVRHEPAVRAWAMSPRTPGRIAHNLIHGAIAAGAAVSVGGILVLSIVGAVDQAAGILL